jgi:hypothetical protein
MKPEEIWHEQFTVLYYCMKSNEPKKWFKILS